MFTPSLAMAVAILPDRAWELLNGSMSRWAPLNDRQLAILRLIGDGNDLSDHVHQGDRITGRALASRGLAKVSRPGGRWSAVITDAGRHYLEHGCHPDLPPDRDPKLKDDPAETARDLIRRLQAAPEKIIRVEQPGAATRKLYRRAVHAAQSQHLVPEGWLLQHTGRDQGDIIFRLAEKANPDETTWNRIRLNTRRKTSHPEEVLAAIESNAAWVQVGEAVKEDALALTRCLVAEAFATGHVVELNTKSRVRLLLIVRGIRREVRISEEYEEVRHQATPEEVRANRRNPWLNKIPEFDSVPSGRLRITLQRSRDKQDELTGLTPANFSSRIRRLLQEVDAASELEINEQEEQHREHQERMRQWRLEQEERDRERRRQEEEKKQRWEQAVAQARELAVANIRQGTFLSAFEAWVQANEIRRFCLVLEDDPTTLTDLAQWIAWGRAEADRIDPTFGQPKLAEISFDIEPGADDLRPFLGTWSPYRPETDSQSGNRRASPHGSYRNPWHHGIRDGNEGGAGHAS